MQRLTETFEAVLIAAGRAEETIRCYRLWLRRWLDWCADTGHDPTAPDMLAVRRWSTGLPAGASSRMQAHAAMRWWCRTVGTDDAVADAVQRPRKTHAPPPGALTLEQQWAMLAAADRHGRKGTAVHFGLFGALRRSEIAMLRWEHIDLDRRQMTFERPKSDDWHTVPIVDELAERLEPRHGGEGWVLMGRNRGHVAFGTVAEWVAQVGVDAGLGRVASHRMRKTCATRLYERTRDVFLVQRLLGHARVTTTQAYVQVGLHLMRDAMDEMRFGPPVARPEQVGEAA